MMYNIIYVYMYIYMSVCMYIIIYVRVLYAWMFIIYELVCIYGDI
jgi:hypothetical protein